MPNFAKLFPNPAVMEALVVFAKNPDAEFYQTQIVEATTSSLMQIQRALSRLEETGLVKKKSVGNRNYYRANRSHPGFEGIRQALVNTVIYGDVIKEFLNPLKKKIKFAFIYGSIARGVESVDSDLDLFIIGQVGLKDLAKVVSDLSLRLGREVNPSIYSQKEFQDKLANGNTFILEVMKSNKTWIIGNEIEFAEMAE